MCIPSQENIHHIYFIRCSEICSKNMFFPGKNGKKLSLPRNFMVKTGHNLNKMEKTSLVKIILFHLFIDILEL